MHEETDMGLHFARIKYKDTADVPWILKRTRYQDLIEKCSQNFKPFVEDLFKILEIN
jgi:hypothetical protein